MEIDLVKEVGNTSVFITHDRLHDIYIWSMMIVDVDSTLMPPASITLSCMEVENFSGSFRFSVPLETAADANELQYILDDGEASSLKVRLSPINGRLALVDFDKEQFFAFIKELAKASEITFFVGEERQTIQLKGISEAVVEYRQILADSYIIELEPDDEEEEEVENPERTKGDELPTLEDG